MTIGTLKSPNPRNRKSISVIESKFLSASSMNTLIAILKVSDARHDVILAGGPKKKKGDCRTGQEIDNQILNVWCRARTIHFHFTFKTSHPLSKN